MDARCCSSLTSGRKGWPIQTTTAVDGPRLENADDARHSQRIGTTREPHLDPSYKGALDVRPLVKEVQHEELCALLLGGLGAPVALIHDLQAGQAETGSQSSRKQRRRYMTRLGYNPMDKMCTCSL